MKTSSVHEDSPVFPTQTGRHSTKTRIWRNVPVAVGVATLYSAFYQIAPHIGVPTRVVLVLFLFSPFVVLHMAYVILRYGEPSPYSFDEKFYDDVNSFRVGREETRTDE